MEVDSLIMDLKGQVQGSKNGDIAGITEYDILSGRGKSNATHIGNVLFQGKVLIALKQPIASFLYF